MPAKTVYILFVFCVLFSCARKQDGNGHPGWIYLTGRYIGKEICEENPQNDYHLIEIITPQEVGDSIVFEGAPYGNVLKAKGINDEFQHAGTLIGFDANISKNRLAPSPCDVSPSHTFSLYEMIIIDQIPFR